MYLNVPSNQIVDRYGYAADPEDILKPMRFFVDHLRRLGFVRHYEHRRRLGNSSASETMFYLSCGSGSNKDSRQQLVTFYMVVDRSGSERQSFVSVLLGYAGQETLSGFGSFFPALSSSTDHLTRRKASGHYRTYFKSLLHPMNVTEHCFKARPSGQ